VTLAVGDRLWLETSDRSWQIIPGTNSTVAFSAVKIDRQHGRPESG